jgi:hypothetical protein
VALITLPTELNLLKKAREEALKLQQEMEEILKTN